MRRVLVPSLLPALIRVNAASGVADFIFYGNYFYGICAVSMMLETTTQLRLQLDGPLIYVMAFISTVLFYNHPYLKSPSFPEGNPRARWFARHHTLVVAIQSAFTTALVACFAYLFIKHRHGTEAFGPTSWILVAVFPATGVMYYGFDSLSRNFNLRRIGWLKPFLIGFVWAGLANVYPVLYSNLIHSRPLEVDFVRTILFIKSFMYISMIAILFDIKDSDTDKQSRLDTLIVKMGLRNTLSYVIIPLTALGLAIFVGYAVNHDFSMAKLFLIMIPFVLLISATRLFEKERPLLFYLFVIDGLRVVKAVFGIAAMYF
jgi:1,4-dihydroxy-2-naphthoate octaprenyltransferase